APESACSTADCAAAGESRLVVESTPTLQETMVTFTNNEGSAIIYSGSLISISGQGIRYPLFVTEAFSTLETGTTTTLTWNQQTADGTPAGAGTYTATATYTINDVTKQVTTTFDLE
ncbi:hypothetical protein HY523_01210, partial [Candidatus Berkelbacteria bacterium]|nr:hypothetical protein [Candidatus Berkelbacteria bacterium]